MLSSRVRGAGVAVAPGLLGPLLRAAAGERRPAPRASGRSPAIAAFSRESVGSRRARGGRFAPPVSGAHARCRRTLCIDSWASRLRAGRPWGERLAVRWARRPPLARNARARWINEVNWSTDPPVPDLVSANGAHRGCLFEPHEHW